MWKLDRLGRDLRDLVNTIHDLTRCGVGFKVLTGHGAAIDTTTLSGKLIFGIFAALAEFERELISERTKAALVSARALGRKGGSTIQDDFSKVTLGDGNDGKAANQCRRLLQRARGLRDKLCIGMSRSMTLYGRMDRNCLVKIEGERERDVVFGSTRNPANP